MLEIPVEGIPVLVAIDEIGPFYGRAFLNERDSREFDVFEDESGFTVVVPQPWPPRSWRVDVPRVPFRLVQPLLRKLNTTALPVEVRLWGAIEQACYRGKAYGLFSGMRPFEGEPYQGLTLHGQGELGRRSGLL